MSGGHRLAVLALLSLAVMVWIVAPGRMAAQPRPVEGRTVQDVGPQSPEPPLGGCPVPNSPAFNPAIPNSPGFNPAAPNNPALNPAVADPPVPVVALRIRVPATATAGQELTYHILVENISNATAHRVAVRASPPTNAKIVRITPEPDPDRKDGELHWTLGTMEARALKDITVIVAPTGAGEVGLTARVAFEHGQSVTTHLNQPELRLRKTGPGQARLNDTIRYQLEVTNTGSAEAAEVVVTDELPEGLLFLNVVQGSPTERGSMPLRWELGALRPGETRRIDYEVQAAKTGKWTNNAAVTARGNLRQTASQSVTVGEPKLSIVKTGPVERLITHPAVFYITVSNSGNAPLTDVEIADVLPEGVTLVSASAGGRQLGNTVHWAVGTLPAGGRKTVQLVLRARDPGWLDNRATAEGKGYPKVMAKIDTHFIQATAPTIEIDKSGDPLEAGKQAVYTVRVVNPTKEPLTNVTLKLAGNEQLKFVRPGGPTAGMIDADGRGLQFKELPLLAAGAETAWTIAVETPLAGEALLKAEMRATQLKEPVKVEDKTTVWPTVAQP